MKKKGKDVLGGLKKVLEDGGVFITATTDSKGGRILFGQNDKKIQRIIRSAKKGLCVRIHEEIFLGLNIDSGMSYCLLMNLDQLERINCSFNGLKSDSSRPFILPVLSLRHAMTIGSPGIIDLRNETRLPCMPEEASNEDVFLAIGQYVLRGLT